MEIIKKGDWVLAEWFEPNESCLSGSQLKFAVRHKYVNGIVRHIRGNHPTQPTSIRLFIEPDEGGEEVLVAPSWVKKWKRASET